MAASSIRGLRIVARSCACPWASGIGPAYETASYAVSHPASAARLAQIAHGHCIELQAPAVFVISNPVDVFQLAQFVARK